MATKEITDKVEIVYSFGAKAAFFISIIIIVAYICLTITEPAMHAVASKNKTLVDDEKLRKIGVAKDFINSFILIALAFSVFKMNGGVGGLKKQISDMTTSRKEVAAAYTPSSSISY
jgi:hypothetical protein